MPTNHRGVVIEGPRANYTPTKPMYLSTDTSGGGKKPPLKPPTKTGGLPDKPDDYDHDWRRSNKELNKALMHPKLRPNKISDKTIPDRDDTWRNDKSKNVSTTTTTNTEYTKKSRIQNLDRKNIELPKRSMTAEDWKKETGNGY